jgi:hypothetical protein
VESRADSLSRGMGEALALIGVRRASRSLAVA